jgi:hypothetical protein
MRARCSIEKVASVHKYYAHALLTIEVPLNFSHPDDGTETPMNQFKYAADMALLVS